ncbi:ribosome silencing factor [Blochmannia endosymbiont of Camponotus (Colobopsis) obliquus]|uniref:ribosome silencing factor n=1 Tax=Blochmannia endosymbiont of Camponotus (Colobopsis) obliquus TaxID=1505597 RepID=UPI00061A7B89|nr:ribosome silencing factor [Blochmannia endosymbiont of Camponotus (Colobopsis) obliquus]AKC60476.1 Ribosomal silencing factor RsfS [Blochmannia endosymbiont of Camponotus (Colobopsis) obliquus]
MTYKNNKNKLLHNTVLLKDLIINIINNLKGENIVFLNVSHKSNITDYMIICTGKSDRHVISITEYITQKSQAIGLKKNYCISGKNTAEWVIIDMGDIILHIMQKRSRKLYELEKLWG